MSKTSAKANKEAKRYPYIPFRPTPLMERRLKSLSVRSGQSIGALIRECISAHLHLLEKGGA